MPDSRAWLAKRKPVPERQPVRELMNTKAHSLQYALVFNLQAPHNPLVWGTENMSDDEVIRFLVRNPEGLNDSARHKLDHLDIYRQDLTVRREDKCFVCDLPSPCPFLLDRRRWRR
jgi:hypothetical protein